MRSVLLETGTGSFEFTDVGYSELTLRVFFFCPSGDLTNVPIVMAMHGLDRAAAEFRDLLHSCGDRTGQIVLVPEFDIIQFPTVFEYNYGGVCLPPPGHTVLPRERWQFGLIDRLLKFVATTLNSERRTYGLFGNSAGAQFVLRYLALTQSELVDRCVASNSGWYMLPDLAVPYPQGLSGLGLDADYLRQYFGQQITVLLGEADTDANAHDLPRMAEALAQGPHRLARGRWYFEHCRQLADELAVPFNWQLRIVPDAGHVDAAIFEQAFLLLGE